MGERFQAVREEQPPGLQRSEATVKTSASTLSQGAEHRLGGPGTRRWAAASLLA